MKKIFFLLAIVCSASTYCMDEIEKIEFQDLDSNAQVQLDYAYRFNLKNDIGPVKVYYLFNDSNTLQNSLIKHRQNLTQLLDESQSILTREAIIQFRRGYISAMLGAGILANEFVNISPYYGYSILFAASCLIYSNHAINKGLSLEQSARFLPFHLKDKLALTNQLLSSLEKHGVQSISEQKLYEGTL